VLLVWEILKDKDMSFISHIRGGLANAQLEVSKHINAASINGAIQDVRNSIDSTAPQIKGVRIYEPFLSFLYVVYQAY
jgi:hypothetical protein